MVTGTGSLIDVSATSHPDLWWGMRGAGFNLGIVTSATYEIYNFTNNGQAMSADFRFHANRNGSLYEYARSSTGKRPDTFSIDIAVAYNVAFGGVSHLLITASFKSPLLSLEVPTENTSRHIYSPICLTLVPWKKV